MPDDLTPTKALRMLIDIEKRERRRKERRERLYDRWDKIRRKSEQAVERMIKRFWKY